MVMFASELWPTRNSIVTAVVLDSSNSYYYNFKAKSCYDLFPFLTSFTFSFSGLHFSLLWSPRPRCNTVPDNFHIKFDA